MRERKNKKKGKDDEMCPIGTARSEKEKTYHNAYLAHKGNRKISVFAVKENTLSDSLVFSLCMLSRVDEEINVLDDISAPRCMQNIIKFSEIIKHAVLLEKAHRLPSGKLFFCFVCLKAKGLEF